MRSLKVQVAMLILLLFGIMASRIAAISPRQIFVFASREAQMASIFAISISEHHATYYSNFQLVMRLKF
jgi:hypothetical protein